MKMVVLFLSLALSQVSTANAGHVYLWIDASGSAKHQYDPKKEHLGALAKNKEDSAFSFYVDMVKELVGGLVDTEMSQRIRLFTWSDGLGSETLVEDFLATDLKSIGGGTNYIATALDLREKVDTLCNTHIILSDSGFAEGISTVTHYVNEHQLASVDVFLVLPTQKANYRLMSLYSGLTARDDLATYLSPESLTEQVQRGLERQCFVS